MPISNYCFQYLLKSNYISRKSTICNIFFPDNSYNIDVLKLKTDILLVNKVEPSRFLYIGSPTAILFM